MASLRRFSEVFSIPFFFFGVLWECSPVSNNAFKLRCSIHSCMKLKMPLFIATHTDIHHSLETCCIISWYTSFIRNVLYHIIHISFSPGPIVSQKEIILNAQLWKSIFGFSAIYLKASERKLRKLSTSSLSC